MSLFVLAPVAAVALLLLLAPGLIATAPLRLHLTARIAAAGVVGVALVGVSGVLFGAFRVPFGVWQPFALALVCGAVAFGMRRWAPHPVPRPRRRSWIWLAVGGGIAALGIAIVTFAAIPEAYRVAQTYDNLFHMSAIAHILDSGDASSLRLRTLIETGRATGFYPAGWHSIVAMVCQSTGVSIPVAANAAWLAVAIGVWVPGSAWLAQVCLRAVDPVIVGAVAMPIAASFGAMPSALVSFGTLYPTFVATALLPAVVAIVLLTGRALRDDRGRRWRALVCGGLATTIGCTALVFAQPRIAATLVVILAPVVVGAVVVLIRRGLRAGGLRRRRTIRLTVAGLVLCIGLAAGAVVVAVRVLGIFDRPIEERLSGPQARATQTVVEGFLQAIGQSWMTGVGTLSISAVLLAAAVVVGAVVAIRTRGLRWIVVSAALLIVLFAFAAGSDDVVTKLATAVWYKDKFRLSSAIPVVAVTLATLGVVWTGSRLARRLAQPVRAVTIVLGWIVAVSSIAVLALGPTSAAIAEVFRMPDTAAKDEIVSRGQITFMQGLPWQVPHGQRVLGDPWDGSGWTELFGSRVPVFPHVNGQWDDARLTLAWRLPEIATDPAVCAALDELRVRYVLYNPHAFAGGDPIGNQFAGIHQAVEAGLFTHVHTDGDTTLYRIDQCGELP